MSIKMMKFILSVFFSLLLALLNGCGSNISKQIQPQFISSQDPQWLQHLNKLKQIQAYQVQGQIGYISAKQRFSSRFHWQYQNPENYTLTLYSPLSTQKIIFRQQQNKRDVFDQNGKLYPSEQIESLLENTIGSHFPLHQLAQWLKGQPEENQRYQVDSNHLLAHFDYALPQENWRADYLSYHLFELPLPKDIVLKSPSHSLKIRTEKWHY